jgi:multidrug efflux pump subunit AcrB
MTSLAAALGMMPLAWAFGSGADMLRPLVIAVIGGLYEQQQIAFRGLTVILIAAILLVFLLLLFLYENFRVAFAMLLVPLFGVAGVFSGYGSPVRSLTSLRAWG